jgi:hypothetical protein
VPPVVREVAEPQAHARSVAAGGVVVGVEERAPLAGGAPEHGDHVPRAPLARVGTFHNVILRSQTHSIDDSQYGPM